MIRITSSFGPRVHPVTGEVGKMHNGVDFALPVGTPLLATMDGVVQVRRSEHAGLYVVLSSGEVQLYFMHMDQAAVRDGQWVRRGDPLGTSGASGRVSGPHLHLGMKYRGQWIDPLPHLELDPQEVVYG